MNKDELIHKLESLKGLSSGSGAVYGEFLKRLTDHIGTMEPGDYVHTSSGQTMAAPIATDLWYLWYHQNILKKYYEDIEGEDFNHKDYLTYLTENLSFLSYLPDLKPLKVVTDLDKQLLHDTSLDVYNMKWRNEWSNNGIYWVNTAFFELRQTEKSLDYPSEGSPGFKTTPNDYVGYVAFPIGQLGVMEVISLFTETDLKGYAFAAYSALWTYHQKPAVTDLEDKYKPTKQSVPEIFPDMKDANGNALAGQHYCYGRQLIEGYGYYKPEIPVAPQNTLNADNRTAYAPTSSRDVELWASDIKDYGEDIKPKKWFRYWIHKDSTFPVPGEFVGILVRPEATPPHVWWFQESSPFLYAGNWMETNNLTSGIVKSVTAEGDRTDGGIGNLYCVAIQGCDVYISASDFLEYSVGDRVAVLKVDSTETAPTKAFSALKQIHLKTKDAGTTKTNYVIIPATYYKIKH